MLGHLSDYNLVLNTSYGSSFWRPFNRELKFMTAFAPVHKLYLIDTRKFPPVERHRLSRVVLSSTKAS